MLTKGAFLLVTAMLTLILVTLAASSSHEIRNARRSHFGRRRPPRAIIC